MRDMTIKLNGPTLSFFLSFFLKINMQAVPKKNKK